MQDIFTGNYGFKIQLTVGTDLSESDDIRLVIVTPKGTRQEKKLGEENIILPKNSGLVEYTVQQYDLQKPGLYKFQAVDYTGDRRIGGEILQLRVRKGLDYKEAL